MSEHWTDRLSAYVDGELTPAEQDACAAHLRACAECRAAADEIRQVGLEARAFPDRLPARDLWPGIAARIGVAPARRRIAFTLPELALAASLLIAVSAGVAWLAATRGGEIAAPAGPPVQAQGEALAGGDDVQLANFADAQYDAAVADLERVIFERRDELDPRTVMVIERNLRTIDQAIRDARAALDADPGNTFLNSHLAVARQRKLDLLRRAALLPAEGGD